MSGRAVIERVEVQVRAREEEVEVRFAWAINFPEGRSATWFSDWIPEVGEVESTAEIDLRSTLSLAVYDVTIDLREAGYEAVVYPGGPEFSSTAEPPLTAGVLQRLVRLTPNDL